MSAEAAILSQLLRGMARRVGYWRRQRGHAIDKRDQVLRDSRAAVRGLAVALGFTQTAPHLSELRHAALEQRARLVEVALERDRARAALAEALGEGAQDRVRQHAWLTAPDPATVDPTTLCVEVLDLRERLTTLRELNRGWARYREGVRERHRERQLELTRLREQGEAWRESYEAARAWRLEVTPRLAELANALYRIAGQPGGSPNLAQDVLDVADALLGQPGADGSPWNRWLETPTGDASGEVER